MVRVGASTFALRQSEARMIEVELLAHDWISSPFFF
jgi:Fe2+ transport system protein FeoA